MTAIFQRHLGAKDSVRVQTRVIAATNQNLENLVKEDKFRSDLLWRLNGKKILLPRLQDRSEDIPELIEYFFSADRVRKKTIDEEALKTMTQHSWPGNVRELKRVCEHLLISSPLPIVRKEDLGILTSTATGQEFDFNSIDLSRGLTELINEFESKIISRCLENTKDIEDAVRILGISRSSLYKKIKDHDIKWRES